MKKIRKFLVVLFCVLLALVAWIQIGSIDQETFDDRGLLAELKPVPDAENGFLDIASWREDIFSDKDARVLADLSRGRDWDSAKADILLAKHAALILQVKASNGKRYFMLPMDTEKFLKDFGYFNLYLANRLLIVESRRQAKLGDMDSAIASLSASLAFSQHIKTEERMSLLSWLVGDRMQTESMAWLHEMVLSQNMSADQYRLLLTTLSAIPPFMEDGMRRTAAGELLQARKMLNDNQSRSIEDRLELLNPDSGLKSQAYLIASAMLPRYYTHANRMSDFLAQEYRVVSDNAGKYCNSVGEISGNKIKPSESDFPWIDFFEPDSSSHGKRFPGYLSDNYVGFLNDRCLYYFQLEAVRSTVAIKKYQQENNGALPESLAVLVPDYLNNLPLEYFDGNPLHYSPKKNWLYTFGLGFHDDGGSKSGFYAGICNNRKQACANSPTVSLILQKDR